MILLKSLYKQLDALLIALEEARVQNKPKEEVQNISEQIKVVEGMISKRTGELQKAGSFRPDELN